MSARPESNSNIPASNTPTTVNCFTRGNTAAGVTRPCGAISVTFAEAHPQRLGEFRTKHDAESTRLQVIELARSHVGAEIGDLLFFGGKHATHDHAANRIVQREHALLLDKGRAGDHIGVLQRRFGNLLPAVESAVVAWKSGHGRRPRECGCATPPGNRSSPTAP